jgi:glycosyltransferase involved in cell wall biosynthesis
VNFSVVAIARNEAKTLPRLVGSLGKFQQDGGEIVIVDTGSKDGTPELARKLGCRVIEVGEQFLIKIDDEKLAKKINARFVVAGEPTIVLAGDRAFDFSSSRNFAAVQSKTDMVAMPDCDECYTTLNLPVVTKVIADGAARLNYNFVFSHNLDGSPSLQFRHSKFYDRRKLKWGGIVHEVLKPIGGEVGETYLDESIIYLEHFQNAETNRGQYLKGLAIDCFYDSKNDRNTHYLARELYYTRRYKSAIKLFEKHTEMPAWQPEKARSMVFIGDCYQFLGDMKSALAWWHRSFDAFASREPLIRLADHYFHMKDYTKTAAYAAAATAVPKPDAYFVQNDHYGAYPYHLLYWAHYWMGEKGMAKHYLDACLQIEPNNAKFQADKAAFFV